MKKIYIRSKDQPNIVYVIDEHTVIEDATISEDVKITVAMSNEKRMLKNIGDSVAYVGRFDPRQIADLSFSDAADIRKVKPRGKAKNKTVIPENTKPEL